MRIARGPEALRNAVPRAWPVLVAVLVGSWMAADAAVLYRLREESTFERGCFPPCDCPLEGAPLAGSFELGLIAIGDVFDFYDVPEVLWTTALMAGETEITGSGSYKVSTLAGLQMLDLHLIVDEERPASYTSDSARITVPFPEIDVPISINGGVCFDTVIGVRARPTPRLEVEHDTLEWDSGLEVVGYDVVQGSLALLLDSRGSFEQATEACLADDLHARSLRFDAEPLAGEGFWFLVRAAGSTYDTLLPSQVGSREPRDRGLARRLSVTGDEFLGPAPRFL